MSVLLWKVKYSVKYLYSLWPTSSDSRGRFCFSCETQGQNEKRHQSWVCDDIWLITTEIFLNSLNDMQGLKWLKNLFWAHLTCHRIPIVKEVLKLKSWNEYCLWHIVTGTKHSPSVVVDLYPLEGKQKYCRSQCTKLNSTLYVSLHVFHDHVHTFTSLKHLMEYCFPV